MVNDMTYLTFYPSALSEITLASDGISLTGLWFKNQKYYGSTIVPPITIKNDLPIFLKTKKWLNEYFSGGNPAISALSLSPSGSSFRQAVWNILTQIPYGQVSTYGTISKILASKMNKNTMSNRAIGSAISHNPISIIIPCHRVIGSNGSLTGYAAGIDIKLNLLQLEKINASKLFFKGANL